MCRAHCVSHAAVAAPAAAWYAAVYSGEVALILHALRAVPADHGAASHPLADVLAAEAALGEERRPVRQAT
jgi:hypothetical protein